jgi:hypothetical protein
VSVSESQRHQVFQWFQEAMGPERAAVIMEMLPPVGWTDLATKDDVRSLGVELRGEMAQLRGEMHHAFARQQRTIYLSVLASNATVAGVVLAAVQLG